MNSLQSLVLSSLLHDIGKVKQRSTGGKSQNHQNLGSEFLDEIGLLLEGYVARYHHGDIPDSNALSEKEWFAWIVHLSDCFASTQREKIDEGNEGKADMMYSPLTTVFVGEDAVLKGLPVEKLSADEEKWKPAELVSRSREKYGALWRDFATSFEALVEKYKGDRKKLCDATFCCLKSHFLQVPSAFYYHRPDISLFSHLHSTSAISVCLWEYLNQSEDNKKRYLTSGNVRELKSNVSLEWLKGEPFGLLVAADLSGIQDFVFSVTGRGAAKLIKARSFIVSMLSHIAVNYILGNLGFPITQALYVGGGNFYLLLPNTKNVRDIVGKSFAELNYALMKKFFGQMYINWVTQEVKGKEFGVDDNGHEFAQIWENLHRKLSHAKKRKFGENLDEAFIDDPLNTRENESVIHSLIKPSDACDVCGIKRSEYEVNGIKHCGDCHQLLELGTKLRNVKWILERWNATEDEDWGIEIGRTRVSIKLYDSLPESDLGLSKKEEFILHSVSNPEIFQSKGEIEKLPGEVSPSLLFYGGANAPVRKDGHIRTFSELAGVEDEGIVGSHPANVVGPHRIGLLRLDVDNLGGIFKDGFKQRDGRNSLTIDRLETLSAFMELFFSYWLPSSIRKWARESNDSAPEFIDAENKYYILYSGGDDMFVIGSWDIMPHLARHIYKEFKAFTGENPQVTFSAGLVFFPPKFPIKRGASITGLAEEMAKGFKRSLNGKTKNKDAINLFGVNVPWRDFEEMFRIGEKIRGLIDVGKLSSKGEEQNSEQKLPRSVLHRLYIISAMYSVHIKTLGKGVPIPMEEFKKGVANARWTWMLAYSLQRRYDVLKDILPAIMAEDGQFEIPPLEWLPASIAWADWTTRK